MTIMPQPKCYQTGCSNKVKNRLFRYSSYKPPVTLLFGMLCCLITEAISRDEWRCGYTAIWHDGSRHEDFKTVLMNCRFKGYDGFLLGRYHHDAQFYLVNCSFAANMKDSAIYLVPTTNSIRWGKRIYYFNCHRDGGKDYSWYSNNLPSGITASAITPDWVFKNRWKPALN